ncbi:hypothetical protein KSP39_PZI009177 [Platanthera zijinensis]|uniref:Uncharacterized protein n=1 Tax=Platanthera zijinensis TaxID=2320716 RepID=A0AAP0BJR2_9ASPA
MVDELRDVAAIRQEEIKRRMTKYFDKHIRIKQFAEGELVLKKVDAAGRSAPVGKLNPNWEGPYIAKEPKEKGGGEKKDIRGTRFIHSSSRLSSRVPGCLGSSLDINSKRLRDIRGQGVGRTPGLLDRLEEPAEELVGGCRLSHRLLPRLVYIEEVAVDGDASARAHVRELEPMHQGPSGVEGLEACGQLIVKASVHPAVQAIAQCEGLAGDMVALRLAAAGTKRRWASASRHQTAEADPAHPDKHEPQISREAADLSRLCSRQLKSLLRLWIRFQEQLLATPSRKIAISQNISTSRNIAASLKHLCPRKYMQ